MSILLTVFNKFSHYLHLFEQWLISVVHVSDCVTTLETSHLVSSKNLDYIDILYGNNLVSYTLRLPVNISKEKREPILSATINNTIDITEYVKSYAGPLNNFFLQPLLVKDIIPNKFYSSFNKLEIMTSDLRIHNYYSLDNKFYFHYNKEWTKYDKEEYNLVLNRLEYLNLHI